MPTGPQIILTLKVLVVAVTLLLLASLVALVLKRPRLHGHINTAFFVLTTATVVAFEALLQWGLDVSSAFDPPTRAALRTHLWFAVPSALLLPAMIVSGKMRAKRTHWVLAVVFSILWAGTVITGLGLPH